MHLPYLSGILWRGNITKIVGGNPCETGKLNVHVIIGNEFPAIW